MKELTPLGIGEAQFNLFNETYFHHPVEVHFTKVVTDNSKGYSDIISVPTGEVKNGKILYTDNGKVILVLFDDGTTDYIGPREIKFLPKEK